MTWGYIFRNWRYLGRGSWIQVCHRRFCCCCESLCWSWVLLVILSRRGSLGGFRWLPYTHSGFLTCAGEFCMPILCMLLCDQQGLGIFWWNLLCLCLWWVCLLGVIFYSFSEESTPPVGIGTYPGLGVSNFEYFVKGRLFSWCWRGSC